MSFPITGHFSAAEANMLISQDGMGTPHRRVHTWGIQGLRIEYDIDAHALELWISPQAGKDDDIRLRNFSNRDDHTTVFDRIRFNSLDPATFSGCDYDPFHLALHFGDECLHLAHHPEHAAVAVWCDRGTLVVDIKTDKQDHPVRRDARVFASLHPDRGLSLLHAAALGEGPGTFWVQPAAVTVGRSAHTRAALGPAQRLVIASELAHEPVIETARRLAALRPDELLQQIETRVADEIASGRLELGPAWKNYPRAQALLDLNRRLFLTYQDASGPLRDGPRYIYSHLWIRAGMNAPLAEWAGMPAMVRRFARFALKTPTVLPSGRLYGQMFGPDSKQEEDGLFYVVWAQHCRWLQDGQGFQGDDLQVQLDALDWLDRMCWDEQRGLYGRFFACETTFEASRDDGWDAPVGAPTSWTPAAHNGRRLKRSYDVYINLLQYAVLRMLAPHVDVKRRADMLAQCARIDAGLAPLWQQADGPYGAPYGWVQFADGGEELLPALDPTDHIWGLTMPPFTPPHMPVERIRRKLADLAAAARPKSGMGSFLFGYTWPMLAADPAWRDPAQTLADFAALFPEVDRAGAFMPMRGAVPECVNIPDGDPFHDLRPCGFAVGQWIAVPYSLGLRRTAGNWAVRGTDALRRIPCQTLGRATAELTWTGGAPICGVRVDGKALEHTLVLPDDVLGAGHHRIEVGGAVGRGPVLIDTEARLIRFQVVDGQVRYHLHGYGLHRCRLADGQTCMVDLDGDGVLAVPAFA